jgi:hypothetical protein
MKKVTITVFADTNKGKNLLTVLTELAKTGMDIHVQKSGKKTKVVIAERGEGEKALLQLLDEMNSGVGFYMETEQKTRLEKLSEEFVR